MINQALKEIRLFHKLSQKELSSKIGISKSYLSEIEANKKNISLDILSKYSDVFDIPVSSLLFFSENMAPEDKTNKLRFFCANKIMKLMEWLNEKSAKNSQ